MVHLGLEPFFWKSWHTIYENLVKIERCNHEHSHNQWNSLTCSNIWHINTSNVLIRHTIYESLVNLYATEMTLIRFALGPFF